MKIKPIYYSLMVLTGSGYSGSAASQATLMLEEVVVTAQKREQSLQDIPLSVSSFSGEEMKAFGAVDFRDLSSRLVNVKVANDQENIDISIRGVSNNRGFAPATAFHIDGIYTGLSQSGLTAFLDVARTEILRGPQGTLYGRNATAGAINVISNRPDLQEASGSLEVNAGNYDLLNVTAVGEMPIIEDKLAVRIAVLNEDRDGYTDNNGLGFPQNNSDDADVTGGKLRTLFEPNDRIQWMVGFDYAKQKGAGPRFYMDVDNIIPVDDLLAAAGDDPLAQQLIPALHPGRAFSQLPEDQQRKIKDDPRYVPVFYTDANNPEVLYKNKLTQNLEQKTYMTEGKIDLDYVDVTFLAGYRDIDSKRTGDNDFWAGNRTSLNEVDAKEQSYELRVSRDGEQVQWLLGLYYYHLDNDTYIDAGSPTAYGSKNTSQAVFSQATWSITDTLALTGGLRYSTDDIESTDLLNTSSGTESVDFDNVSWRASLEQHLAADSMVYLTISTGYKTGGLNGGSQLNPIFDDETIIAYELGSKNQFLDGRIQLNAALFYYDYSDLQVSGIEVIPQLDENGNPIPDPDAPGTFLVESVNTSNSNIPDSEMYGAEVELVALITDNFRVDSALGLLHTEVGDGLVDNAAIFGATPTDVSGNELRKAPPVSFNTGLQYTFELPSLSGSLVSRLDFYYEDAQYHDVLNRPQDKEGSYTKTDISATFRPNDGKYFVQLYVRNLEDNDVRTTIYQSPIGALSAYAPPRTYGVRVGVNF